ncbi:MAG: RAD55 family ATPase [Thermoplasmata archaeon]
MIFLELRKLRQRVERLERRVERQAEGRPPLVEERVKTFVAGFDDALGDGIPRGHVVMIHGPVGTMKTSLALYIASKNEEEGMTPLYISLEESKESLQETMASLGIKGKDFIVDIATMRLEHGLVEEIDDWFPILKSYLQNKVTEGIDLLVIDSLNSLYPAIRPNSPRGELFRFFSFLRDSRITSFLVYEGMEFHYREEHMVDGLIEIAPRELEGGQMPLWMRCVKLRLSDHSRDYHRLEFRRGRFMTLPVNR